MKTTTIYLDTTNIGNFFGSYKSFLMAFDKFLFKRGYVLEIVNDTMVLHDPRMGTIIHKEVIKEVPVYKDRVIVKDRGTEYLLGLRNQAEGIYEAYKTLMNEMPPKVVEKEKIVEKRVFVRVPNFDNGDTNRLKYNELISDFKGTSEQAKQGKMLRQMMVKFNKIEERIEK